MQLLSIKRIFAGLWVTAACIAGILGDFSSFSSWTVLAGVALLPPVVMMWRWHDPAQTMSEAIQEARR